MLSLLEEKVIDVLEIKDATFLYTTSILCSFPSLFVKRKTNWIGLLFPRVSRWKFLT